MAGIELCHLVGNGKHGWERIAISMKQFLAPLLVCPRCRAQIVQTDAGLTCSSASCALSSDSFPIVNGQPALIDFDNSIVDRDELVATDGSSVLQRTDPVRLAVARVLNGINPVTHFYAADMLSRLRADRHGEEKIRILVIGGGSLGYGTEGLYNQDDVVLIGMDIYASDNTALVADAHSLPFVSGSIDAVWIQAVLEHVVEPWRVVEEIRRVLRRGGVVFADSPFLWPVHEASYDFMRFSVSGHRWLFKGFDHLSSGYSSGAGVTLLLAIRCCFVAMFRSSFLATLAALPLFWIRYLDRIGSRRGNLTSAAGVFFYGVKADREISPKEILAFYETQIEPSLHER